MKRILINFLLLLMAFGSGAGMFLMKQRVVEYEKQLAKLHNDILADKREIHTLKADWAVLTEPSRLRKLLSESAVHQIHVKQVITADDVSLTPVPVPPQKPFNDPESEAENVD